MKRLGLASLLVLAGCGGGAHPIGNERGGVIPVAPGWSEGAMFARAQQHCAKYGKSARITSLQGHAGGNALFECV